MKEKLRQTCLCISAMFGEPNPIAPRPVPPDPLVVAPPVVGAPVVAAPVIAPPNRLLKSGNPPEPILYNELAVPGGVADADTYNSCESHHHRLRNKSINQLHITSKRVMTVKLAIIDMQY